MFYDILCIFSASTHQLNSEDDTLPALTQALIPVASQGCTVGDLQSHPVCVIQNLACGKAWKLHHRAPHEAWDCGYMCSLRKARRFTTHIFWWFIYVYITHWRTSTEFHYLGLPILRSTNWFTEWWSEAPSEVDEPRACHTPEHCRAVESLCWSQRSENCRNCSGVFQMQKSARTAVSK